MNDATDTVNAFIANKNGEVLMATTKTKAILISLLGSQCSTPTNCVGPAGAAAGGGGANIPSIPTGNGSIGAGAAFGIAAGAISLVYLIGCITTVAFVRRAPKKDNTTVKITEVSASSLSSNNPRSPIKSEPSTAMFVGGGGEEGSAYIQQNMAFGQFLGQQQHQQQQPISNPYFAANGSDVSSPLPGSSSVNSESEQPKAVFAPGQTPPSNYSGLTSSSIAAVGASQQTLRATKLAATMSSAPGNKDNAAYNRGVASLAKAASEAKHADQAALMARITRNWSGKKAEDMTVEEACLIAQRGWKNYRTRKLVNMWVKIVAFDGDVFYRNKVTGTLEWEIPTLPAMSQAEKAKETIAAANKAPSSSRGGTGGGEGAVITPPTILTDEETGDTYVYENGSFYFFDGKGGALLKSGWRRMHDETDVWYVDAAGTTSWDPVYRNVDI